jgi:hypothetical protein
LSSAPKAASPGCGWTCRRIDKAGRGVQASLVRRDGYGPLIPWAEAPRLPSNHRYAVPQEVQTPARGSQLRCDPRLPPGSPPGCEKRPRPAWYRSGHRLGSNHLGPPKVRVGSRAGRVTPCAPAKRAVTLAGGG